ncbi:MAG: ComF family protein [Muribaculaceae bacterium]|nr:ComF family protein [Muribaculaceae bacterium]
MKTPRWIKEIAAVIYPDLCHVCNRSLVDGESALCLECLASMPRTGLQHHAEFNDIHRRVAGHAPIDRAAAYFHYDRDSGYSRLIHHAKYGSHPGLARKLGARCADEFNRDHFFDGIDIIEPVPLHWWKQLRRGYNQSHEIALGISSVTGIPVASHLSARHHSSQTRLTAASRRSNATGTYSASDCSAIDGLHILIVDDIITTGSTMNSCAAALHDMAPRSTISLLAMGLARLS